MTNDALRTEAWKKAFECCGTQGIFNRRLNMVRLYQTARDFLGVFVPAGVGLILTSIELSTHWTKVVIYITLPFALGQLALSVMSLVKKWDDEGVASIQSVQANNRLRNQWESFGKGNGQLTQQWFDQLTKATQQQEEADLAKNVAEKERRYGMRYALREYHKECVGCGKVPVSLKPSKCDVCGNF